MNGPPPITWSLALAFIAFLAACGWLSYELGWALVLGTVK